MRSSRRFITFALLACVAGSALLVPPARAQSAPAAKPPLYDRLGGLMGITQVVDDFLDKMVVDKELNLNPHISAARARVPAPYLKFQVAALMCQVTGGPCKYVGRDMKSSHAELHISEKNWQRMVAIFKTSLAKYKVPQPEQEELFAIIGGTKADIVTEP